MNKWGTIDIKLDELIKKKNFSKNKLSREAELQYHQVLSYCNKEIKSISFDVLCRLCTTLNCKVSDILEFIPNEDK